MSSIHLCVDVRMLNASGIGTFIKNILPHLLGKMRLSLLYLEKDEEELLSLPGCNLIPMKSQIYTIAEQFELPRKIPACDLFWSPHFNIPLFPIKARKRLVKIHDVAPLAFFSSLSLLQKIYAKLFFNAALLISDKVTTVSEFSSSEIKKYCFVKKNTTPIASSIAPRFFNPISQAMKEATKKKYRLPNDFLLFVGNVKPHKNLKRLLEAFKKIPNSYLVLLGEKEKMGTVDKKAIGLVESDSFLKERVLFTGYVEDSDVPAIYALAKLCIFPSLYEGFGLPPLEALACGCPSVVANMASMPEICGDAVEYVDPLDIDSIAAGIAKLLSSQSRCSELLKNGEKLLTRFAPKNSAESYIKLIESIL